MYPRWEKRRYEHHYKAFIKENYTNRLDRRTTLTITDELIMAAENGSESKVPTTELQEIIELPATIFIRLKGGQSFILPKDKIAPVSRLILRLKELALHLKIDYTQETSWTWK